jgi:hypothetical protein
MARRVPVMRLKSVDFPTFGRPTSTTVGSVPLRFAAILNLYSLPPPADQTHALTA